MRLHRAEARRRQLRRRRAIAAIAAAGVLLVAGVAAGRMVGGGGPSAGASEHSRPAERRTTNTGTSATSSPPPKPTGTVTLSAVGDTMLGYANTLAPDPGHYFDGVRSQITGDIRFANLEGTLTDLTSGKCAVLTSSCYEFRVPPGWARYFKRAGFTIVSNANNHAFDFWQGGLDDTVAALDRVGL